MKNSALNLGLKSEGGILLGEGWGEGEGGVPGGEFLPLGGGLLPLDWGGLPLGRDPLDLTGDWGLVFGDLLADFGPRLLGTVLFWRNCPGRGEGALVGGGGGGAILFDPASACPEAGPVFSFPLLGLGPSG